MSDIVERLRDYDIGNMEAADEVERLLAENKKLRAAFRVNMLRAFPSMSHDEIDAEIAAAIRESGDE